MNTTAARRLARNLMIRHGLGAWRLDFMNHNTYAGLCHFKDHLIELSVEFTQAYDQEQLTQLVLHEIAHALRGRKNITTDSHDDKWLRIARRIGYLHDETMPAHYPKPRIVWDIVCTTTGLIQQVHTAPDPEAPCKNCNSADCTPEVQRRQIVRADIHTIPAPPHIYAPAARAIRRLFQRP